MIKQTTMVSNSWKDDFLVELGRVIEAWQKKGLAVDVQYSISDTGRHYALLIGREEEK